MLEVEVSSALDADIFAAVPDCELSPAVSKEGRDIIRVPMSLVRRLMSRVVCG
jgi:hypothetical protein